MVPTLLGSSPNGVLQVLLTGLPPLIHDGGQGAMGEKVPQHPTISPSWFCPPPTCGWSQVLRQLFEELV